MIIAFLPLTGKSRTLREHQASCNSIHILYANISNYTEYLSAQLFTPSGRTDGRKSRTCGSDLSTMAHGCNVTWLWHNGSMFEMLPLAADDERITYIADALLSRHERADHEGNVRQAVRDFLVCTAQDCRMPTKSSRRSLRVRRCCRVAVWICGSQTPSSRCCRCPTWRIESDARTRDVQPSNAPTRRSKMSWLVNPACAQPSNAPTRRRYAVLHAKRSSLPNGTALTSRAARGAVREWLQMSQEDRAVEKVVTAIFSPDPQNGDLQP